MGVCLSKKSHNGKLTDIFRSNSRDSSTTTYFESATTFMREFSSFDGGHCRLHARLPRVVKMVVLGCENTGKSTIIRQLRLIHGQKFTEKELKAFKKTIQDNTWSSYKTIVNLIDFEGGEENNRDSDLESVSTLNSLESDFRLKTAKNEKHEIIVPENIISLVNLVKIVQEVSDLMLTSELVSSLQNLKGIFDKLNLKITLSDREKYLISNTPRILNTNYTPSDTDILNCKSVTTGPTEYIIENCCQKWLLIDTCGRKEERKNWIHCFEKVHVVLYVIALNQYIEVEKFQESVRLFAQISSAIWFRETPVILLLNKIDKFRELVNITPITVSFQDCEIKDEDLNFDSSCSFLKKLFDSLRPDSEDIFTHFTCAIRKFSVDILSAKVSETIISENLGKLQLV